jgi:hypothetical protein
MTPETQGRNFLNSAPLGRQRNRITPDLELAAGFVRDARIITTRGVRPVQDISAGDLVITRDNGVVAITGIEQRSLITRAVYVIAGSIGHRNQDRDTMIPCDQTVLLRDWRAYALSRRSEAVVPAQRLVDGEFVRDVGLQPMTLFRVYCSEPQVLYADGMELGTADLAEDVSVTA